MEFLDVVNGKDEVVGSASIGDIYGEHLPHRIVHVFVFNERGELALQMRSAEKKRFPHHWCTSAGGHVQSGESYEDGAARELKEELGIEAELKPFAYDLYESPPLTKFLKTFTAVTDKPFTLNSEVDGVAFFDGHGLRELIASGEKIHPELVFLLKKHFDM